VLTRIQRGNHHLMEPYERIFATLIVLFGVLFVFSAVMSVLIARSMTESVRLLDGATRRIAAGELDRSIEVKGSNEITSLAASLNSMRLALKDDQARRSRFIMGVTHDLKTPLAFIKGYAEAIGDGMADSDEARDRYVDVIATKVDQLAGMIDDLIEFVRVDTVEWRRRLQVVPLAPFLRGLCRRVEADAMLLRRRAECSIDIGDEVTVAFDEHLVARALENIVNNALRYTAEGGLVRIDARVEVGTIILEISDNGPGIEASDMPNIFDPFYRGSASRREQGMGLGLAVVKGIIDSHGWNIAVQSEPGAGSQFIITILPI
jgi:signal transduction histidine kinase